MAIYFYTAILPQLVTDSDSVTYFSLDYYQFKLRYNEKLHLILLRF